MNQVKRQAPPSTLTTWFRGHLRASKEGLHMPMKTPFSSLLTITTLAICFFLPMVIWLLWLNFSEIQDQWQQQGSIAVFIEENVALEQVAQLQQELEQKQLIETVQILQKEEVKQQLRTDPQLKSVLDIIENQQLPHQLFLTPVEDATDDQLERFVNTLIVNPNIEYVSFDTQWYAQLKTLTQSFFYLMQASIVVFLIIVFVVLIYTIGTEVAKHQHEIKLTQLLGATPAQIRRRFLYTGTYFGIASGILAIVFLHISLWWVKQPIETLANNFTTGISLRNILFSEGFMFFFITISITWIGSRIALQQNLK